MMSLKKSFNLLLVLSLGLTAAATEEKRLSIYSDLIDTICSTTQMTINVNVDSTTMNPYVSQGILQKLEKSDIFLNDCLLKKDEEKKNTFTITTNYQDCGLKRIELESGQRFLGTVNFPKINVSVPVACGILSSLEYKDRVDISMDLQTDGPSDAVLDGYFPSVLNGPIQVKFSPFYRHFSKDFPQIYTYPVKCIVYDYHVPENKVIILEDGCPRMGNGRDFFLSQLYQPTVKRTATSTDIRFVASFEVFPETRRGGEKLLGISCEVFHCVAATTNSLVGFPNCPIASATCSKKTDERVPLKTGGVTYSARLPVPIKVDLSRVAITTVPAKDAVSNNFIVNIPPPKLMVECAPHSANTGALLLTAMATIFFGLILGFIVGRYGDRVNAIARKLHNCRESHQDTRCGSVLQADAAPQPYLKLDSNPITPESPALE